MAMPDVKNCKRCGRIFNYLGGPMICPVCKDQDEVDYRRVKEYLYDKPGAPMSEVSTVLDVSIEKIKRFLKEGRLEIKGDDANFILECESCGKSINTGRLCKECERTLHADLRSTFHEMSNKQQSVKGHNHKDIEMRYLRKDNK